MKKPFILIGLSIFISIGLVTYASAQKIHCWDLNQNYECDLPDEDLNGDGKCNSRDCQGESGNGIAPNVYDSSEPPQYIGMLLGHLGWKHFSDYGTHYAEIFLPNLKSSILINKSGIGTGDVGGPSGEPPDVKVYFRDSTCGTIEPQPYMINFYSQIVLSIGPDSYRYFLSSTPIGPNNPYTFYSFTQAGICQPTDEGGDIVWEATEIAIEDLPFLPITLPLVYE